MSDERLAEVRRLRPRARRARRAWLRQWPIALVIAVMLVGFALVALDRFRVGAVIVGAGVGLAFVLRLVLRPRAAGMLAVRSRSLDLGVLGVLAAGILVFALWVPAPT